MLTFVGLGLYDERSITIEGRDAVRSADHVFVEQYTSRLAGASVSDLEAFHDVVIQIVDRDAVEGDPASIISAAESGHAVVLVGGDPMISTTHVDLRLRADDRGIETRIVHGTTAQSAASGLTGLQNYRFGKATTLPFPGSRGPTVPGSVVETIDDNHDRGLHTLVYLDIEAERDDYLTADRAAAALKSPLEDCLGVAVGRAGSPDPVVVGDRLSVLADTDFGEPLHLLVIPGELHHIERDALRAFAAVPVDLLPEG